MRTCSPRCGAALAAVLEDVDPARVSRFNLSTTLSTNSIVEGKTEDVGVFVAPGPGVDTENFRIGGYFYILPGSIDHRGKEIQELGLDELAQGAARCREAGVRVFASVGKFSTRNPAHETLIADALAPPGRPCHHGPPSVRHAQFPPPGVHGLLQRGGLGAPTTPLPTPWKRPWPAQGLTCPCNILKADGGTMPLSVSRQTPVESILSGPAASVMGIIALCTIHEDCVILDIGGTTTDIAVFASGTPLLERDGIDVGSYPTLVRALKTVSIGIGGGFASASGGGRGARGTGAARSGHGPGRGRAHAHRRGEPPGHHRCGRQGSLEPGHRASRGPVGHLSGQAGPRRRGFRRGAHQGRRGRHGMGRERKTGLHHHRTAPGQENRPHENLPHGRPGQGVPGSLGRGLWPHRGGAPRNTPWPTPSARRSPAPPAR